jgi:diacylglycerol kinase family enzyme
MGFDAAVSYKFSNEGTRGFITYIKTTLTEFFKYKAQDYIIDIDGVQMEERAFVIACCNAAQYGNNAYIAPRATMQDGLIDVTVMHGFSLVESPLVGARLFFRSLDKDRHVSIYRGKQVVIKRKADDVMHIDGDPVMMPARLEIENVSAGIRILVPPTLPDDV